MDEVHQWLDAGCRSVWVVDPQLRTIAVYDASRHVKLHHEADRLTVPELLPGFEMSLREVFEG